MKEIKNNFSLSLELKQSMCESCKRSSTEYFQLKAQIRFEFFNDEEIKKISKKVYSYFSKNLNVNNLLLIDQGVDVYFREKSEMEKVSSYFKDNYVCSINRSKKLIGRDNLRSKDTYKYFISVIIYNIKRKSKFKYKGEDFEVINIDGDNLVIRNLETGKKRKLLVSKNIVFISF